MYGFKSFVIVSIVLLIGTVEVFALDRDCTNSEEQLADAQLAKIADNATLSNGYLRWHLPFGTPEPTGPAANERLLIQGGFVMSHDDDLRTALWVAYRLTAKDRLDADGKQRVRCFRKDPRIETALTADPLDYKEPRFDQGHMANDADLKDSLIEQINSYVMSNMSPQECRFNRGIWLSLEHLTRAWATEFDTLYVISGAIFDRDDDFVRDSDADAMRMHSNNGQERVAVPSHYYKVILRRDGSDFKSISFLLENTNDAHGVGWDDVRPHIESAIVSMEEIEDRADLRLHPDLDRNQVVQSVHGEGWNMESGRSNFESGCQG